MGHKFIADDAESADCIPRRIADYVPDDSLARFIAEAVSRLDLSGVEGQYAEDGRRAYPPKRLLAVWLYGYATGVNTSRPLARNCKNDLRYIYLSAGLKPKHDTLLRFRNRCEKHWDEWMRQILLDAADRGLVDLSRVCVDGTKMKGSASLGCNTTLILLRRQERVFSDAMDLSERASSTWGEDEAEHAELRSVLGRKLERVRELERELVRQHLDGEESASASEENDGGTGDSGSGEAKLPDDARCNTTDPDSRVMKTAKGSFEQGFNGQIAVDPDTHLVMAGHVSQAANDKREIEPALEEIAELPEELGKAEAVIADAGYFSRENLERCENADVTPFIAPGRRLPDEKPSGDNNIDDTNDSRTDDSDAVRRNAERLADPDGRQVYAQRSSSVETVFGILRSAMKFNEFHLRGMRKVNAEWKLVCAAWNLKRMHRLLGSSAPT